MLLEFLAGQLKGDGVVQGGDIGLIDRPVHVGQFLLDLLGVLLEEPVQVAGHGLTVLLQEGIHLGSQQLIDHLVKFVAAGLGQAV